MAAKKKDKDSEEKPNFEESLQRLEKIVSDMESGALGLEEMIARFEEGQKLIGFCTAKLDEVERKIEMLVKRGDTVAAAPFESEKGEAIERGDGEDGAGSEEESELF